MPLLIYPTRNIRRVAVIASLIIPLIGLIANCPRKNHSTVTHTDEVNSTQHRTSLTAAAITPQVDTIDTPIASTNIPTDSFTSRLQTRMPHLYQAVAKFQQRIKLTDEEYELNHRQIIIDELGMTEEKVFTTNYFGDTIRANLDFEDLFNEILIRLNLEDKIVFAEDQPFGGNFTHFAKIFSSCGGYGVNLNRENQGIPLTDHKGKLILEIVKSRELITNENFFDGSIRLSNNQILTSLEACIQLLAHLCV